MNAHLEITEAADLTTLEDLQALGEAELEYVYDAGISIEDADL